MMKRNYLYLLGVIIFLLIIILVQNAFLTVRVNDVSETLNQWELNEN